MLRKSGLSVEQYMLLRLHPAFLYMHIVKHRVLCGAVVRIYLMDFHTVS